MTQTWLDKALEEMASMVPKAGFNVVGVDPFEPPGEALYLVLHTDDRAAAETARDEHTKRTGNAAYVYEPDAETT